jgi:hypothetical protein
LFKSRSQKISTNINHQENLSCDRNISQSLTKFAIAFATYLSIRVSNLLIDRFSGFLKAKDFAMLKPYQRLDIRVSTVSQVLRNVTAIVLVGLEFLVILSAIGFGDYQEIIDPAA